MANMRAKTIKTRSPSLALACAARIISGLTHRVFGWDN